MNTSKTSILKSSQFSISENSVIISIGSLMRLWLFCLLVITAGIHTMAQDYVTLDQPVSGTSEAVAKIRVSMVPGFNTAPGIRFSAYTSTRITSDPEDINVNGIPSETENYIRTISYREATDESNMDIEHLENIHYFDGLGRLIQTVDVMASPSGKDIVQPVYYDDLGRESRKYLPFATDVPEEGGGNFKNDAFSDALDYYRAGNAPVGKEADDGARITIEFENSPLNRVLSEIGPGEDWYLGGHKVQYEYKTNSSAVPYWKAAHPSVDNFTPGSYEPHTLFVYETTDEQGNITREYKDKQGKIVQKEVMVNGDPYRTAYIYDDFDHLRVVVPPEAEGPSESNYCYYYHYDKRGRIFRKRLPGADWVYIYYDKIDRLVLTQDGKTRNENSNLYYFTKYDKFSRPVMTGTVEISDNPDVIHTALEDFSGPMYEEFDGSGNCYGYTYDHTYPFIYPNDVLTVTYYDNYDFIQPNYLSSFLYNSYSPTSGTYNSDKSDNTKGYITGSMTRLFDEEWPESVADNKLFSVLYYDDYGNVTRSITENHLGGRDIVFTRYKPVTFEIEMTEQQHKMGTETYALAQYFYYDHTGRLLETRYRHKMSGETESKTLNAMRYNELGELVEKYLHSNSLTGTKNFLQKIDYRYNIREWLTVINNPDLSEDNDLFGMKLYYTNADEFNGSAPQDYYNGNISALEWNTKDDKRRGYGFTYDGLNRLVTADYSDGNTLDENAGFYSMGVSEYDKNGNIKKLLRKYNGDVIDDLIYHYHSNDNSNNLLYIEDAGLDNTDVDDYLVQSSGYYTYDGNGNMITDPGKSTDIDYNYLNLPQTVSHNNAQIYYLYDAAGTKRTKLVSDGVNTISTTNYIGNIVYENGVIAYILTPEGRLVPEETAQGTHWKHEYFLKDHLGNARVTFTEVEPGVPEIVQSSSYYPFGLAFAKYNATADPDYVKNNYLYNGKELQDDLLGTESLNWYDYGARYYDPALGRFTTPDPLGELIPGINPYHYCYNNPVALTDPTGMWAEDGPNYIASTFVDPSGKIIKVIDDDDPNIYLVHDPENWDGKSKDGLLIIGQTPEPNTLAGFEGQNINSESVINYIFDEAERLGKQEDTWMSWIGLAHLNEFAQLMRSKEEQLKLLAEMKNLEKKRAMILLQMLKNNELMLSDIQKRQKGFTDWLAGRIITRTLLGLYGSINLPGDEAADYLFPESILDEIDREFDTKNSQIIKKYDEMMKDVQNR